MTYTIQDFGPSDLLTSSRINLRRLKTSSEPSIAGATENGLAYTISGSFTVANGAYLAMNFSPAAESVIHQITVSGDYPIEVYDASATGTADGIFSAINRNLISLDESPAQGQLYYPASLNGDVIAAGVGSASPFVRCGFDVPVCVAALNNSGAEISIRITIEYEEIGPRAPTFGLTASTQIFPETEMSVYG